MQAMRARRMRWESGKAFMQVNRYTGNAKRFWAQFWMRFAGLGPMGRLAARMATIFAPPYKGGKYLAHLNTKGYVSPQASISCNRLHLAKNVFIGDRVIIYGAKHGGAVRIADRVNIHRDCIIETGHDGSLFIGEDTHIQPRCQFSAYKGRIEIGRRVQIAPNCAFYPYDHGFKFGTPIMEQPLKTRGGILIEDDAWLGVGVIVLDGCRIGKGAVIGAGSVVKSDIPDYAVAAGVPAKVIRFRENGD
jgi:acetyltransferase-like isoleucine patch superfamily enzyme